MAVQHHPHRWLSVLAIIATLTVALLGPVAARSDARRSAAVPNACSATYWSHSYDDECRAWLRHTLVGERLTAGQVSCLAGAGVGMFFGGVGGVGAVVAG